MKNIKSKLQLFEGLWAIDPAKLYFYRAIFKDIIINGHSDSDNIKVEGSINYIVDENGKKNVSPGEETPPNSYGIVHLVGPMVKYGNWWFWGADELVAMLEAFESNPNIKGTILKIDSGGGHVAAVPPFLEFMQRKTKPVVSLGDTVGSAAQWVASSTDYTIAENNISAMFGSIGVMINFLSFKKYYEQLGIEEHIIYSKYSEDKNKSFELALEGKYELIKQEHLDPLAIKFQNDIKLFRGNKLKLNEPGIITGKMFYADKAVEIGLADSVGNEQLAIEKINELATVQNYINNF